MTAQQLQSVIRATPFRPFSLHLADGRAVAVSHPEMIAHAPTGRIGLIATGEDGFEIVDLLLVMSLKVEPSRPATAETIS